MLEVARASRKVVCSMVKAKENDDLRQLEVCAPPHSGGHCRHCKHRDTQPGHPIPNQWTALQPSQHDLLPPFAPVCFCRWGR